MQRSGWWTSQDFHSFAPLVLENFEVALSQDHKPNDPIERERWDLTKGSKGLMCMCLISSPTTTAMVQHGKHQLISVSTIAIIHIFAFTAGCIVVKSAFLWLLSLLPVAMSLPGLHRSTGDILVPGIEAAGGWVEEIPVGVRAGVSAESDQRINDMDDLPLSSLVQDPWYDLVWTDQS